MNSNQIDKAVILCGFDHSKKSRNAGIETMVSILSRINRKSLVSIDQTLFIGNEKFVADALKLDYQHSYLIISPEIKSLGYDYVLFEYDESQTSNAPGFIFSLGDQDVSLASFDCQVEKGDLIMLFNNDSERLSEEVPILVYQQDSDPVPSVQLDKGKYVLRIKDALNQLKCEDFFTVQ